jgi:prevent-host-death family protein
VAKPGARGYDVHLDGQETQMKKCSIADARDQFTSLLREVEEGATVELTRRGKPIAVLLALPEYERLASGRRGFAAAYRDFLRRHPDFLANAVEPEDWLHDVRDSSPGRDFAW